MVTAETHAQVPKQCLVNVNEKSISRKNPAVPFEKCPFRPVLTRDAIMLHNTIHFSLHYLSNGRSREVKTKENFKLLALRVVAVAYERWSLTRGSKYSDLAGKLLVCWKIGR